MSAVATAGHPPDISHGAHGGGLAGAFPPSTGSNMNGDSEPKGSHRVLPHIDDLTGVKPEINAHASISRLLQEAETFSKQADTHLDFRRPDLALEEYIKAYIITVDYIPRHKEFPELKRGSNLQIWTRLQKRINAQHATFEDVKASIKLDNAKSGVLPRSRYFGRDSNNGMPKVQVLSSPELSPTSHGEHHSSIDLYSSNNHYKNASALRKPAPRVQPKPDALHGKTLHQKTLSRDSTSSPVNGDLAARFARLRGAESPPPAPVQDPRIRTRPIVPQPPPRTSVDSRAPLLTNLAQTERPYGPRDMPGSAEGSSRYQSHKFPLILDTANIPSMPRAPDAVYSPARGLEDPPSASMSRASSRASFNAPPRTNSMSSVNGGPRTSTMMMDGSSDYFSATPVDKFAKRSTAPNLPDRAVVSAKELYQYIKRGSQLLRLLLVDVRDRSEFDEGHIMASSIVCIEPIILRKGISGEDLSESMLLSPEAEQRLFDRRHEFDLIVYYDQSSTSDSQTTREDGTTLRDFSLAVFDYSYEAKQLRRRPTLLVGGLDAWTDMVGTQALATSNTLGSTLVPSRSQASKKPTSGTLVRGRPTARRQTYESRPLTKEQENEWNETLNDEEVPSPSITRGVAGDNWSYARTTEDFFRRFPEVSTQESMMVPRQPSNSKVVHQKSKPPSQPPPVDQLHHDALAALMPRPPTRPTPAVPRPSYSGVTDRNGPTLGSSPFPDIPRSAEIGPPPVHTLGEEIAVKGRTGLSNLGNSCYMNSVLQTLSATPLLSWYLMTGDFEKVENKPQRRVGEMSDPPQLMARNLANLLRHLWSGQFTYITPKTFRNYVRAVHCPGRSAKDTFGGEYQQDGAEFLVFILQLLDDELNTNRHKVKGPEPSTAQMASLVTMPAIQSAVAEWNRFFMYESSPINRLFGGQYTVSTVCSHCRHCVKRWDTWIDLAVPILETRTQSLDDALRRHFAPEALDDYKCEGCHRTGGVIRTQLISRCPTYMIIDLKRATDHKIKTQITFPLNDLDLTPHFVPFDDIDMSRLPKEEYYPYIAPFRYKCYAVIQHEGATIDSGHYWTLIRDLKQDKWWEMNDQVVKEIPANKTQTTNSYILFYKRV